jgi:hypothetical protein
MPFVTTIIARLLAIQDWYLGQFVDVSAVTAASANNCWSFNIVNATVNPCGQEMLFGNSTAGGGWASIMGLVNLTPVLLQTFLWTGPFANWTPYIPNSPPPIPAP